MKTRQTSVLGGVRVMVGSRKLGGPAVGGPLELMEGWCDEECDMRSRGRGWQMSSCLEDVE